LDTWYHHRARIDRIRCGADTNGALRVTTPTNQRATSQNGTSMRMTAIHRCSVCNNIPAWPETLSGGIVSKLTVEIGPKTRNGSVGHQNTCETFPRAHRSNASERICGWRSVQFASHTCPQRAKPTIAPAAQTSRCIHHNTRVLIPSRHLCDSCDHVRDRHVTGDACIAVSKLTIAISSPTPHTLRIVQHHTHV
jgi:hypothetical protein